MIVCAECADLDQTATWGDICLNLWMHLLVALLCIVSLSPSRCPDMMTNSWKGGNIASYTLHLVVLSAVTVKSIPVHSLTFSFYFFFCLPHILFLFSALYGRVFAEPENLRMYLNHLSFPFLLGHYNFRAHDKRWYWL